MRTHVRLARCCFCFCPCAVMPLLCTKKIPISNRSSHSSRDARARSLTQFRSQQTPALSLLTQHSGCCHCCCCCCWVSGGCFSIGLFCWSFFVAERTLESEREHCWVKRARAMSGNLSTKRTVSASCLKFAVWKKCECACESVSVCLCECVCVCAMGSSRWLDNIRRVNWPNEHNRDFRNNKLSSNST